jgi:hypothetical protein
MARFGLFFAVLGVALMLVQPLSDGQRRSGAAAVLSVASESSASRRPAGTLVFLSRRNRLTSFDVSSGRRTVRRMRSLAGCGPELQVTAGHLIFAGVREQRTIVFSMPVSLDRPAKRLGAAHTFVPSVTEGRVWLAGVDCDRLRMVGVKEVTVDGRVTAASARRVPSAWLAGAVEAGLLLQRRHSPEVWDPATGRGRRLPLEAVVKARGNLVVGCKRPECRRLVVVDAATARAVVARPRPGYRLDLGVALPPEGSLMAAPAVADRRWSVALVDTDDGRSSIVPGSHTGADYPELSWSASSGWLFIRANDRIMAYRPGGRRAITLPIRPPRRAVSFIAG